ncbi:MAG: hypothetical protein EOM21_21550, partial [Gammaproteobacteria bacterium]|nr:hypothetical protein [Gammaproteobacteria bacterium]
MEDIGTNSQAISGLNTRVTALDGPNGTINALSRDLTYLKVGQVNLIFPGADLEQYAVGANTAVDWWNTSEIVAATPPAPFTFTKALKLASTSLAQHSKTFRVTPGKSLKVSAVLNTQGTTFVGRFGLYFINAEGTPLSFVGADLAAGQDWTEVSKTIEVPAGAILAKPYWSLQSATTPDTLLMAEPSVIALFVGEIEANAEAISDLRTELLADETGTVTLLGEDITAINLRLDDSTTGLDAKASTEALDTLGGRVEANEGNISTQGQQLTTLNSTINHPSTGLATRASATALTSLTTRVTATEGDIASQATQLSQLTAGRATNYIYPGADLEQYAVGAATAVDWWGASEIVAVTPPAPFTFTKAL